MRSVEFVELQLELFGEKALHTLQHLVSSHELNELASSYYARRGIEGVKTTAHSSSNGKKWIKVMTVHLYLHLWNHCTIW
jgi:hypothetical protein